MNNQITVVIWNRNFYAIPVTNPCLYYFIDPEGDIMWEEADKVAPQKFLRIPNTAMFEYGGTPQEAARDLTDSGFRLVDKNDI